MAVHNVTVNHLRETIKGRWKNSVKLCVFIVDINLVYFRCGIIFSLDSAYSLQEGLATLVWNCVKMSMIYFIILLWRSPSLFRWDRFIFDMFLLVDHTVVKCWCLSRHLQIFFSALNEVHQFLSQRRSALVLTQSGLTSQLSKSNKHDEHILTFWPCCCRLKYTWTENENLWSVGFNQKCQGCCLFSKPRTRSAGSSVWKE